MSDGATPIIDGAGGLLQRYDVLFCDVWGVVHDGYLALAPAADALRRFRRNGGTVILVSNAPVPNHQVARMLDERQLPREAWDAIVSSGDIALRHIEDSDHQSLFPIGPQDRDAALFEKVGSLTDKLECADAILCSGLNDDIRETAEDYRDLLQQARGHGLPFVCANPDLVVDVGGTLYLCAGAIGDLYQEIGGEVFWAGKPYENAYMTALTEAERLRGEKLDRSRLLVIGDSVRTDLTGAKAFGVDALFIANGIHREEAVVDGAICRIRLAGILTSDGPPAVAAMPYLSW
jgi:HAD superfamily hydrolase (TIGR01459 family)